MSMLMLFFFLLFVCGDLDIVLGVSDDLIRIQASWRGNTDDPFLIDHMDISEGSNPYDAMTAFCEPELRMLRSRYLCSSQHREDIVKVATEEIKAKSWSIPEGTLTEMAEFGHIWHSTMRGNKAKKTTNKPSSSSKGNEPEGQDGECAGIKHLDYIPTHTEFLLDYVTQSRPVILKGQANKFAASNWTWEDLIDIFSFPNGKQSDSSSSNSNAGINQSQDADNSSAFQVSMTSNNLFDYIEKVRSSYFNTSALSALATQLHADEILKPQVNVNHVFRRPLRYIRSFQELYPWISSQIEREKENVRNFLLLEEYKQLMDADLDLFYGEDDYSFGEDDVYHDSQAVFDKPSLPLPKLRMREKKTKKRMKLGVDDIGEFSLFLTNGKTNKEFISGFPPALGPNGEGMTMFLSRASKIVFALSADNPWQGGRFDRDETVTVALTGRMAITLSPPDQSTVLQSHTRAFPVSYQRDNSTKQLSKKNQGESLLADTIPFIPDYTSVRLQEPSDLYKHIPRTTCVIEPGDILYVPAWWWHETEMLSGPEGYHSSTRFHYMSWYERTHPKQNLFVGNPKRIDEFIATRQFIEAGRDSSEFFIYMKDLFQARQQAKQEANMKRKAKEEAEEAARVEKATETEENGDPISPAGQTIDAASTSGRNKRTSKRNKKKKKKKLNRKTLSTRDEL